MAMVFSFMPVEKAQAKEAPMVCCYKQIDCPGWFNGNYEACLVNGDGNSCTCGVVSRSCPE